MRSRTAVALGVLLTLTTAMQTATAGQSVAAGEYAKHFAALSKLSVAVAQAMPADQYSFRPHPESMDFGQLMSHTATTNYQFCAGLKDTDPPALPSPTGKDGVVKFLSDSFEYCAKVIPNLTEDELKQAHNSPDGHLPGREILLANVHPRSTSSRAGGNLLAR